MTIGRACCAERQTMPVDYERKADGMTGNVCILCAARDRRAMSLLRRELEQDEEYLVQIVSTGQAALECAVRSLPDILVIDSVLPGMDGLGVVDALVRQLGKRAPKVIAGSMMDMADEGFRRRGAYEVLRVPWDIKELVCCVRSCAAQLETVDWQMAKRLQETACLLLQEMGMDAGLKGCLYLAWCAAIAACSGESHPKEGKALYQAVAGRLSATESGVERLIRHALESAMNENAGGMYAFFGNTIDPMRGKPTNAQAIRALAERLRIS